MRNTVALGLVIATLLVASGGAKPKKIKPTLNGKSLNLLQMNLSLAPSTGIVSLAFSASPSLNLAPGQPALPAVGYGGFSVNQSVPAAAAHYVPSGTSNPLSSSGLQPGPGFSAPAAGGPSFDIVTARPDFQYNAARLAYQQRTSATTGQITMAVGPGRPAGSRRFVPVGEF